MNHLSNTVRMLRCIARETGSAAPIKVLIVDDDHQMLKLMEAALTGSDTHYAVTACDSYRGATAILGGGCDFDLCVVDQRLGDGTGLELIHGCQERGIELPFLMVTGVPEDKEVMQKSIEYPYCLGFMSKDSVVRELDTAVRFTIRNFAVQRTALKTDSPPSEPFYCLGCMGERRQHQLAYA